MENLKQEIYVLLEDIENTAQDEGNGIDILREQLQKAVNLRSLLEETSTEVSILCNNIEDWIAEVEEEEINA